MRVASAHHQKEPNYYELALLLAHGQIKSLHEEWADFIDHLSRICDGFAQARVAVVKATE